MPLNDYYPETQLQQPDLLGNYLRGAMAPGAIQGQQQQLQRGQQDLQMGGLQMEQLRMILQGRANMAEGFSNMQGAAAPGNSSGGIQNGPQSAVSGAGAPLSTGLSSGPTPVVAAAASGLSPGMAEYLKGVAQTGGNPFEVQKQMIENQRQQAQYGWANDPGFSGEAFLRQMTTSKDAPNILRQNWNQLGQFYTQAALSAGVDARDINSPDPMVQARAVNKVGEYIYNQRAIPIGAAPIKAPTIYDSKIVPGVGLVTRNPENNETKIENTPTYSIEKGQDMYGHAFGLKVQTGGVGAGGGGAGARGAPSAPGTGVPAGAIPLGVEKPTEAEERSAGFATVMGANLPKMEQAENKGVFLSPKVRTQLLDVVVNENPSAVRSFLSQELLKTIPQDQRNYIYASLPVLQAVAHQQAGQRGMTPNTLRANLESMIPQAQDANNPEGLATMRGTRQAFLATMDAASGSLGESPDLHAIHDRRVARASGVTSAPATALAYLRQHPESADHFKAKYGYLP